MTNGRYGEFGGQYAAETLMFALTELEKAYLEAQADPAFDSEFRKLLREYAGRPSLLYRAERLSADLGTQVFLKREDLNHTGAHKINNAIGQVLLAKRVLLPRPGPASTALQPRRLPPFSGCHAMYSWARKTRDGRHLTCTVWSYSGQKCILSQTARLLLRMRQARPSVNGPAA